MSAAHIEKAGQNGRLTKYVRNELVTWLVVYVSMTMSYVNRGHNGSVSYAVGDMYTVPPMSNPVVR